MSIGSPEDCHIWKKFGEKPRISEAPWTEGAIYEILPKASGTDPMATRTGRRKPISEGPPVPVREGRRDSVTRSGIQLLPDERAEPSASTSPEKRLATKFKYEDGSTKEWSDVLNAHDTEALCSQRAMSAVGEYGARGIINLVSKDQGKTLDVSKKNTIGPRGRRRSCNQPIAPDPGRP
jgi:hypothetical protein